LPSSRLSESQRESKEKGAQVIIAKVPKHFVYGRKSYDVQTDGDLRALERAIIIAIGGE
jgi:hypothetical protein